MPPKAEEALRRYREKRHFADTPEPSGGEAVAAGARYLVQKHAARRLHYDFRLELDGVLLSWAVTKGPSYDPRDKRLAVRTEDHPLAYGGFEGVIPPGQYGGGTVMLWDEGSWAPLGDARAGLAAGKLAFILHGQRLRGRWALVRMRGKPAEKRENWLLIKERDELAGGAPELLAADRSVRSGRSMAQIAAGAQAPPRRRPVRLPGFAAPSLATLVEAPPEGPGWQFEIKYDGYRALIAVDGQEVRILTRTGLDWTARYPGIAAAMAGLGLDRVLLDGEITVIGPGGVSDFAALVAALEGRGRAPLSCFLFDILVHQGRSVRGWPLTRRRALLEKLLGAPEAGAPVQLSAVFTGDGAKLLATACAHGLEGLVAKRAEAPYRAGRQPDWLKIKCARGQEFVVAGFVESDKPGRPFASLALALREGGGLRYAGRVGSGLSARTLAQLAAWRDAHRRRTPPCAVPAAWREGVQWVEPVLVAEIGFAGWTQDRLIRQGRFLALRADKPAQEVEREMPKPSVQITHPERLLYAAAGLSKADVAAYVQRAAPLMWPYMRDRFLSLVRCPDGVEGSCFFQRHLAPGFGQGWAAQEFTNKAGEVEKYMYATAPEALLAAVQMGTLEFHLWGARRDRPPRPDRLVFDLDPGPDVGFAAVREAAARLRDVLAALGLESLPMLSGGKGVHVVVALRRTHDFPVVKQFCGDVARRLAADAPETFTATMRKDQRQGRIFIDYFRNEIGATAVAPFSPRARAAGAVAWPCSWDGLRGFASAQEMTIPRAMAALAQGSPWAGLAQPQSLSQAALRAVSG